MNLEEVVRTVLQGILSEGKQSPSLEKRRSEPSCSYSSQWKIVGDPPIWAFEKATYCK